MTDAEKIRLELLEADREVTLMLRKHVSPPAYYGSQLVQALTRKLEALEAAINEIVPYPSAVPADDFDL